SKTALEYLWRTGALSVLRREGFQKVYELTERVLPAAHAAAVPAPGHTIDWACNAAIDRLGFATSGEIAAFFATVSPTEANDWCAAELGAGRLIEIDVEGADGQLRRSFARPDVCEAAAVAAEPPGRTRILSPFDPALRDRKRAERLFGFHYRIEVFVPEPQRKYGYYVFPVLEGARLIGRVDAKADRATGQLNVRAFWPERGLRASGQRIKKLETALDRLARFAGCDSVSYAADWQRDPL
ncbi:winged helix-turn-helix domain-containing protein, partial [Thioclava sp. BHET1]